MPVGVGVWLGVAVAVGVGVLVAVGVGVSVGVAVAVAVGVEVWVAIGVGVAVAVGVGVRVGAPSLKNIRTGTQSRRKSRLPPPAATLVTRTRNLPSRSSDEVHVRPQVSVGPPRRKAASVVPSVPVVSGAVQVSPLSPESSTHMKGLPPLPSVRASSRISMPSMVAPVGRLNP